MCNRWTAISTKGTIHNHPNPCTLRLSGNARRADNVHRARASLTHINNRGASDSQFRQPHPLSAERRHDCRADAYVRPCGAGLSPIPPQGPAFLLVLGCKNFQSITWPPGNRSLTQSATAVLSFQLVGKVGSRSGYRVERTGGTGLHLINNRRGLLLDFVSRGRQRILGISHGG